MRIPDRTVLVIFIIWMTVWAGRIAFKLYREYQDEARNRAALFAFDPVATESRSTEGKYKTSVGRVGDCDCE